MDVKHLLQILTGMALPTALMNVKIRNLELKSIGTVVLKKMVLVMKTVMEYKIRMTIAMMVEQIGLRLRPTITTATVAKMQLKTGMMIMMALVTKTTCVQLVI